MKVTLESFFLFGAREIKRKKKKRETLNDDTVFIVKLW